MKDRRDFLKMFAMAAVATIVHIPQPNPEKLTIACTTGDGDMRIGTKGVERMRIYASGNVGIACINPSYELKINTQS